MADDTLPEGYAPLGRAGRGSFAWAGAVAWAETVLAGGVALHEWASEAADAQVFPGRGPVYGVPAPASGPDGRERWAVRHYHRGGLVATIAEDRYLSAGAPRPLLELRASVEARARGVPTPAVVAGVTYPKGPSYQADLVTELVPDAVSLREGLFGTAAIDPARALHAAGRLVRLLEEAAVGHADLSAGNVLVERATGRAHAIDLDRAEILPVGADLGGRLLDRLERSLRKLERVSGRPLAAGAWRALRDGYREPT